MTSNMVKMSQSRLDKTFFKNLNSAKNGTFSDMVIGDLQKNNLLHDAQFIPIDLSILD